MRVLVHSFLFTIVACISASAQCNNTAPAPTETTRHGGNELIAYKNANIYKSLRGVVSDIYSDSLDDVLVEVFDHPEWIQLGYSESRVEQRRIAAYKTKPNGRFCFDNLPPGAYELRLSKNKAWNVTHVYVVINPRERKRVKSTIEVKMYLGS